MRAMNCTQACPKGLNPAKAIADIKKKMVERRMQGRSGKAGFKRHRNRTERL